MRLTFTEVRPVADAGEGPGGGLILDHSEARRAEKFFLADPPPPPFHPLSQGLDPTLSTPHGRN